MKVRRLIIMVVTSLLAAATILYMQSRFEHADERNALVIVQQYRSRVGTSVPALLSLEHPGRPVHWSTATTSSCFQHITVVATVAEKPGAEPHVYAFAVDLNGPSIHPANEEGAALMGKMDVPLPPTATASASSSASAAAPANPSPSAVSSASAVGSAAAAGARP